MDTVKMGRNVKGGSREGGSSQPTHLSRTLNDTKDGFAIDHGGQNFRVQDFFRRYGHDVFGQYDIICLLSHSDGTKDIFCEGSVCGVPCEPCQVQSAHQPVQLKCHAAKTEPTHP